MNTISPFSFILFSLSQYVFVTSLSNVINRAIDEFTTDTSTKVITETETVTKTVSLADGIVSGSLIPVASNSNYLVGFIFIFTFLAFAAITLCMHRKYIISWLVNALGVSGGLLLSWFSIKLMFYISPSSFAMIWKSVFNNAISTVKMSGTTIPHTGEALLSTIGVDGAITFVIGLTCSLIAAWYQAERRAIYTITNKNKTIIGNNQYKLIRKNKIVWTDFFSKLILLSFLPLLGSLVISYWSPILLGKFYVFSSESVGSGQMISTDTASTTTVVDKITKTNILTTTMPVETIVVTLCSVATAAAVFAISTSIGTGTSLSLPTAVTSHIEL